MSEELHDPWAHEDATHLLQGLNDEQARAVQAVDGPVLILAGAGSGKTKTLTHRIAYILAKQLASPANILAVTFTNKAAKEMRERVASLTGNDATRRSFMPFMGTFHAICVRILRQDGSEVGLDPRFVIIDESDRLSLMKRILSDMSVSEKQYSPRTILGLLSSAKNELMSPLEYAEIASTPPQKVAADAYRRYESELKKSQSLDFDDLIGKTVAMLSENEAIRKKWQTQFRYVMIDEYQDTNAAQYTLVKLLTNEQKNICVVGDDWQSIYSWRGADFRNILNFERDYPGAVTIKLEQNYRSTKSILDAAHTVIAKNADRSEKKLWTDIGEGRAVHVLQVANERAEGEAIIRAIKNATDLRQRNYHDYAVLYRTNAQSRSLEEQFMRHGVPYKIVGGLRFYDRKEIKDILAYLRLIYQPEDEVSFERVVNVPGRGIGDTSLAKFRLWRTAQNYTLAEALEYVDNCGEVSGKAKAGLVQFADIVRSFRSFADTMPVSELLQKLLTRIDYIKYIDDGTLQGESRTENVRELQSVAKSYADDGLTSFLEEVALVSDKNELESGGNAVTFMTMHAAKGLEFPVVFIVGMEEGVFPLSRANYDQKEMEEERRLAYVGMTRAKEELTLVYASSRVLYGSMQYNPPSQFLDGIGSTSAALTNLASSAVPNEPRYVPELSEGDEVEHQLFGMGVVVHIDGDVIDIVFKGKGVKKLNASFAPIKKR